MKKTVATILIVISLSLILLGCNNDTTTPTATETEPTEITTISEFNRQYSAGESFLQEQKYTEAINAFNKAILIDETYTSAYINRGNAYFELSKTENNIENLLLATSDFSAAIDKGSSIKGTKLYDCYVELGNIYVKDEKPYDALVYYEKAYNLDKSNPYIALTQKAWIYKLDNGNNLVTYFSFDFDNTGYVFDCDVVDENHTLTYELSDNSLRITRFQNMRYNWTYDTQTCTFNTTPGNIELIPAKDAFRDWYNNIDYITSQPNHSTNQFGMNSSSSSVYKTWDSMLNVIYSYLIDVLPTEDSSALTSSQVDWIVEKESAMESAASEYAGGTMAPLIKASTGAQYTKERVEELINMIPEP